MADSAPPVLVWFRQDLRLSDNPALAQALKTGAEIVPVYILDDKAAGQWALGGAARWWLHHALADLGDSLVKGGSQLILRQGDSLDELQKLISETGARAIYWNRRYEPYAIAQDKHIKEKLSAAGIEVQSFSARLLNEPWTIKNGSGLPFRVFTPYWKACVKKLHSENVPAPLPVPKKIPGLGKKLRSDNLDLLPTKPDWSKGMAAYWKVGEKHAQKTLHDFIDDNLVHYTTERDFPAKDTTSHLSPYLAHGQISPRQCWHAIQTGIASGKIPPHAHAQAEKFIAEIGWREFAYHLLFHFPETPTKPLYPKFENFPWRKDTKQLRAWQKGKTGYPIVDAGMRQLWQTGWMHNRVRMVVGSLLVKHLLLPWQDGAKWFWDTLVDADLASNTLGWQWVAGCGADAAPYFRIFNPTTQAEKFDKDNLYIKEFVPEFGTDDYQQPIVDHNLARKRALEALAAIKGDS